MPVSSKQVDLKNLRSGELISMLFIAKNEVGYGNLMELSSKFFLNDTYRLEGMSIGEIDNFSDGLICLSGGDESPINNLLKDNKLKEAENCLLHFKKTFGDRFYFEINRHPLADNFSMKLKLEDNILELADKHKIPLVATNDVYFLDKNLHQSHDALYVLPREALLIKSKHDAL